MIALPWYLLAGGIVLLVIGLLLAAASSAGGSRTFLHARMNDDEIAQQLSAGPGDLAARLLIVAGLLTIFVSVVWRLVRILL